MFVEQAGRCYICDGRMSQDKSASSKLFASFDHVIPRARGGANGWLNIKLAHRYCNNWKSDRRLEDLPQLGIAIDGEADAKR